MNMIVSKDLNDSCARTLSKDEWTKVRDYAQRIVLCPEQEKEPCRLLHKSFFSYLTRLEKKYGRHQVILATKADFLAQPQRRVQIYREAYQKARICNDAKNCMLIASSMSGLYIFDLDDFKKGRQWLRRFDQWLSVYPDADQKKERDSLVAYIAAMDKAMQKLEEKGQGKLSLAKKREKRLALRVELTLNILERYEHLAEDVMIPKKAKLKFNLNFA